MTDLQSALEKCPLPWRVVAHSWSESSIYEGEKFIIGHSIDNDETTEENQGDREAEQARLLQRICDDHNALDGINPAAVPGMRDALEKAALVLSGETMTKGELVAALEAARAALKLAKR